MTRRWWFWRTAETPEKDGYAKASEALASLMQANGELVWPVRSADPGADWKLWIGEAGDDG